MKEVKLQLPYQIGEQVYDPALKQAGRIVGIEAEFHTDKDDAITYTVDYGKGLTGRSSPEKLQPGRAK